VSINSTVERSIYHKNLMPVTYVNADVAGSMEARSTPFSNSARRSRTAVDGGYEIQQLTAHQPFDDSRYAHEVGRRVAHHVRGLRDLGIAWPPC